MRIAFALILTIFLFSSVVTSCRKDLGAGAAVIDSTDYRHQFVGDWCFKQTTTEDYWLYAYDSLGNGGFQHSQTSSTSWENETGTVIASSIYNQILVTFSNSHSTLPMIVNSQGYLSCVDDCEGYGFYSDPQYGGGPQGCWHIDSTYCQALGGQNLPGHVTSTVISGYKIE
jgi:hypothetical protein